MWDFVTRLQLTVDRRQPVVMSQDRGICQVSSYQQHVGPIIVIYIIKGDMFVCLFVCSVWPAKRLGRSRPNLTHALMSTQGVFLARSMSRSFMYACESDRSMKHPERCANTPPSEQSSGWVRTPAAAPPSERLWNAVELHSSSNVRGDSGTPSGGRVIRASNIIIISQPN